MHFTDYLYSKLTTLVKPAGIDKLLSLNYNTSMKRYSLLIALLALIVTLSSAFADITVPSHVYNHFISLAKTGKGDQDFFKPEGMCFSPDGRFLAVTDTHNNRLKLYEVNPDALATMPLSLAMIYGDPWPWDNMISSGDRNDRYREDDYLSNRYPAPNYLSGRAYQQGQGRTRPADKIPMDHFNLPTGIGWLGTSTMLIADTGNHRIKAMKLNGEIRFILGQEGWKDGYFHHPLGIDTDCAGRIYTTEPRSKYRRDISIDLGQKFRVQGNRIQIFDTDLKPSKRLGHMHHMSGRDYRQLKNPTRVWVDINGDIYVCDNGNHRILVFENNMQKKEEIIEWEQYKMYYPNSFDVAKNGWMAIADTGNHKILILDEKRKLRQIIGGFGTQKGKFIKPHDVKFGPNGDLFVLDTGNGRIQIFKGMYIPNQFPRCPVPEPIVQQPLKDLLPPSAVNKPKDSY